MKDRRVTKCVLELDETARTLPIVVDRLRAIRGRLNQFAGILAKIDETKMRTNPVYWSSVVKGWSDHIRILSAELAVIHNDLTAKIEF